MRGKWGKGLPDILFAPKMPITRNTITGYVQQSFLYVIDRAVFSSPVEIISEILVPKYEKGKMRLEKKKTRIRRK